jgi:hypothetical protein
MCGSAWALAIGVNHGEVSVRRMIRPPIAWGWVMLLFGALGCAQGVALVLCSFAM